MSSTDNPIQNNPNDYKVVEFHNSTDFTFTPEMGCRYDGRPIFGITGAAGINAGETITLPYHIGHRLATNLAKIVQIRRAPTTDAVGIPTGVPLWSPESLEQLKNSYIKELYVENSPIKVSETDRLMAKVEEYKKMVDALVATKAPEASVVPVEPTSIPEPINASTTVFQDKQEVIAELEKWSIPHDKRQSKATLEKLLT